MSTFQSIALTIIVIAGIVAVIATFGHYIDKDSARRQELQIKCLEAKGEALTDRYGNWQTCRAR